MNIFGKIGFVFEMSEIVVKNEFHWLKCWDYSRRHLIVLFLCNVWSGRVVATEDTLSVQIFDYLHQIHQDSRVVGRYLLGSVETRLPNVKIIIDELGILDICYN